MCGVSTVSVTACRAKMRVRIAAVLLLLVLQATSSHADRTNERNQTPEVTLRQHESGEKTSGRRWTTTRNSPYQKIVSRYDRAPDVRESGSELEEEASAAEVPDEAKAKSSKRKQWRTNASSHDQIPSESSSDGESQKAEPEKSATEATDTRAQDVPRNNKLLGLTGRRRSPASSHPRELTTDFYMEPTVSSSQKRRRPAAASITTTTLAPQTMSDSLYQYFRPLDQDVPQDDIIPFLDFGRKLSPVLPTPTGANGANSIENKSTVTKPRSRVHHEETENNPSDEESLQEDMDVTVVKKAIERNSVPRGRIRVREQGISDFYRKRVPAQIRTTENLISSSDSSTASSVPGSKTVGLYKKNRHQIHHVEPHKVHEDTHHILLPELKSNFETKDIEIVQQKRRQFPQRPIHRSAALKQEPPLSPLTAESSLVKTIIREPLVQGSIERASRNVSSLANSSTNSTKHNAGLPITSQNNSSSLQPNKSVNITESKPTPKIISTAVVTSVSIDEKENKQQFVTGVHTENNATRHLTPPTNHPPLNSSMSKNKSLSEPPSRSLNPPKTSTNNNTASNSSVNFIGTSKPIVESKPFNNLKNDSSLRSREIYKPKAVPPGIPHLPRTIPIHMPPRNLTTKVTFLPESSTMSATIPTVTETVIPTTTTHVPSTVLTSRPTSMSPIVQSNTTTQSPTVAQETSTVSTISPVNTHNKGNNSHTETETIVTSKPRHAVSTESVLQDETEFNITQTTTSEIESPSGVISGQTSVQEGENSPAQETKVRTDLETAPPPKMPMLPSSPSAAEEEEQFPIYFTTSPTATVPVVDTRPETETAVVEEQRNVTTPRPLEEWVKAGAVNKDVEVVYPEPLGLGAYLLAGLGVVPVILGALIGARFLLAHNKKKVLDESEYSSEYNRSPLGVSTVPPLPTKLPRIHTHINWSGGGASGSDADKNVSNSVSSSSSTVSTRWEFPREKLRLQTLLGQGNFGQVWKAEADDIAGHEGLTRLVAVKTVKESANAREREDLLRELGIMQELGSHPNVVTLLGCCTEKEPIYLMMEYVMYGKLLSFLRDHRTRAHYYNFSDAGDALTSRDLTVFGYCVARGMDYLSNKSIIHRDLAARNILVDHNKLCKIADFGMSRNVRDTGQIYEQRQSKGALPIRWMAPESLHFSLFTHKTDVWSFGILMWEIVTLGSTPYATMGAREVMRRVRDGYRLERPSHCRLELFRVISQCWSSEPAKRPSFAELKVELGQLLSDTELNGSYVDLESFADDMRRDSLHRHH